jgi:hypothetical protein
MLLDLQTPKSSLHMAAAAAIQQSCIHGSVVANI